MSLNAMGWSAFFESNTTDTSKIARVTAIFRSHISARTSEKEINLYYTGQPIESLAVGDWVTISPEFIDEQNKTAAVILSVLDRKSKLARIDNDEEQVLAANVDRVFIVTSANQDFNIKRLQRYLVLVKEGGSQPVIILSKVDLTEDPCQLIDTLSSQLKTEVIATSTVENIGRDAILMLMPEGSTSVFVGSSGVGKSTLVNFLMGHHQQKIREIRYDDDKGKHTTTTRQLFSIPGYGMIIDTPGLRAVQVYGSETSLQDTFPEISQRLSQCRFSDCQHETEPGCAIQSALESGELSLKDWESYLKLLKEIKYSIRKTDKQEMSNSKRRWKSIHKNVRAKRKFEDRE
ncbi:MAG: ribosome small subunit-dependent GTPase A [Bdellovibrionales bacterium]|nr:ribosome small subunit-dependent GTPase A [Bdellovibrionales bacterium]